MQSDFFIYLKTTTSIKIYSSVSQLPQTWDDLAIKNIFLSKEYLKVLEKSAPTNMICHFIGFFENEILVGISLSQFLNLNELESFGERDKCIKTAIRNFAFKNFCSHVLLVGNNMLTGQNAYLFSDKINPEMAVQLLKKAILELKLVFKKKGLKVHLTSIKDFDSNEIRDFENSSFQDYYQFSIQPNMIFDIPENWKSENDYINALSKKYRDQYKRARKKSFGIEKRKLHLDEIIKHEKAIYDLYYHVAKNAHFNTFFLSKNHFSTFKAILKDKFLFYGYFLDEKLVGFNTLIKNGEVMDTYFLGYDDNIQREKMLYINMLYDMIGYSINKGFKKIVFARTALEIKSSVGAKPQKMFGFIKHNNSMIDKTLSKIFCYLEPNIEWQERHPFK